MSYLIEDLLNHIILEVEYLQGNSNISEENFMFDETLQRAFVRSLEVIGEATKKIPKEIKENYPDVLWNELAGLRNRLVHDYFGIDYSIVWDIIKNEIPILIVQINNILKAISKAE